jgi:hypothetical protein
MLGLGQDFSLKLGFGRGNLLAILLMLAGKTRKGSRFRIGLKPARQASY